MTSILQDQNSYNTQKRTSIQFTNLLPEVKACIYEHAMRMEGHFDRKLAYATQLPYMRLRKGLKNHIPPPCQTNKLERSIAIPILIRNAGIKLNHAGCASRMTEWLEEMEAMGCKSFAAVRKLEIDHEALQPSWPDYATPNLGRLFKCPALREIILTVSSIYLADGKVVEGQWDPVTGNGKVIMHPIGVSDLAVELALDMVLDCTTLRRLTLNIPDPFIGSSYQPFVEEDVDVWAQWIRDTFRAKHGRALEVEMVCKVRGVGRKRIPVGRHVCRSADWKEGVSEQREELDLEFACEYSDGNDDN